MKTKRYLTAAIATAALIGLSGCGGSSDQSSNDTPATTTSVSAPTSASSSSAKAPGTATNSTPATSAAMITISNFDFGKPISVSPGATVMVMNKDSETHSVTADTGDAFNTTVSAGGSATFTAPTKPGSYPFHCSFHAEMHGTLTVK